MSAFRIWPYIDSSTPSTQHLPEPILLPLGHDKCLSQVHNVMTHQAIKYTGCIESTHEMGIWARIVSLIRSFIKSHIPEGYEDRSGFHFGIKHSE